MDVRSWWRDLEPLRPNERLSTFTWRTSWAKARLLGLATIFVTGFVVGYLLVNLAVS